MMQPEATSWPREITMKCARRDVFLLLEPVADYSPLAPVLCARRYGRDCQFNEGHDLGRIPAEALVCKPTHDLVERGDSYPLDEPAPARSLPDTF